MGLFTRRRTDGHTHDGMDDGRLGFIDRIKYDGPYDSLVWKFPYDNLSTMAQLIVNESQEAILYRGGQALDLFGPGTHTLSTGNIPLLQNLINLPFGGQTPFSAEIWYINKTAKRDIKWGTKDPINIQDPHYRIIVPVRTFGEIGIRIEDARCYMTQIVGTLHTADIKMISNHFRSLIVSKTKDTIGQFVAKKGLSLLQLPSKIDEISSVCKNRVKEEFEAYGIGVVSFYVESINFPEDDPSVAQLQKALAKKAEMDIIGYTYQQERTYDTLEKAADNNGHMGGMMGAGMGMAMGVGLGGPMGRAMAQVGSELDTGRQPEVPCPQCRHTNDSSNKFCSGCGEALTPDQIECPQCSAQNALSTRFCTQCGSGLTRDAQCPQCGEKLQPSAKFCGQCGTKAKGTL